jgi:uncharacterized protein
MRGLIFVAEMRPDEDGIDAERREKLILGVAAGVTATYEYFGPERRRIAAERGGGRTSYRQAERKIGRNDPYGCASGKKYKHCCPSQRVINSRDQ